MTKLEELQQLLETADLEQTLQVILEKDQPFGKRVMDLVRDLNKMGVAITPIIGEFAFTTIRSFGKTNNLVSTKRTDLFDEVKRLQKHKWAMAHKCFFETVMDWPDGYHAAGLAYDHMDGYYPSLKTFRAIAEVFFDLKSRLGREPSDIELYACAINTERKFVRMALKTIRYYSK